MPRLIYGGHPGCSQEHTGQEEPNNLKLKMEHEEENVVGDHEEDSGGGGDTVDEDTDDDMDGWDENGDPYQPFIAPWYRPEEVMRQRKQKK
ncbi:unnamed protein product [Urochloa humidicola]